MNESIPYDRLEDILNSFKKPFSTVHNFINTVFSIVIIVGIVFVGYIFWANSKVAANTAKQIELINKFYVVQNRQTNLLKIVDANLRNTKNDALGSASMEDKVRLTQIWFELSNLKSVPLPLLCAIADVESSWCMDITSPSGCKGLLQVNPTYSRPYLRERGINYKVDIFNDPVINSIVGVSILTDFQDDAIEKSLGTKDNWSYSIRSYFWGPSLKNNILDMNYTVKILDRMKKYNEDGL